MGRTLKGSFEKLRKQLEKQDEAINKLLASPGLTQKTRAELHKLAKRSASILRETAKVGEPPSPSVFRRVGSFISDIIAFLMKKTQ